MTPSVFERLRERLEREDRALVVAVRRWPSCFLTDDLLDCCVELIEVYMAGETLPNGLEDYERAYELVNRSIDNFLRNWR